MSIPEFILDSRAPKSEQEKVANAVGDFYLWQSKTKGTDQNCSDLIHNGVIQYLYAVSRDIDKPLAEILKNEKIVKAWARDMYIFDAIRTAISNRFELNNDFIFEDIFRNAGSEKIPHVIANDLQAFGCWCIIHGATSDTIRKNVQTASYEKTLKYERSIGKSIFVSALFRASCAYLSLGDKAIIPALEKIMNCQNDIKINSMAASLKPLLPTTKPKHRKAFRDFSECFQSIKH